MLEMQLWVQSDNPDYQKAVAERLEEMRVKGEEARRLGRQRELARESDREQFKKDLFDGLVSLVPQEKAEVVLCAEPPKEVGHLSDSEVWNGYEWERD
jgi:hypothetical protein